MTTSKRMVADMRAASWKLRDADRLAASTGHTTYTVDLPSPAVLAVADWLDAAAHAWGRMPDPVDPSPAHVAALAVLGGAS